MAHATERSTRPEAAGLVIHGAARYDALVWLFTLGGERRFRRKILALAELQPGETVLDIGCGTGTLAIEAKRAVGETGVVHGVDASPEMIARARAKARAAKSGVRFVEAPAQKLPFDDGSVDVVLSTLMLHHLPKKARPEIAREVRRVLKPGGRFLAVDFAKPAAGKRNLMDRFHRHGFIKLEDLGPEFEAAGLSVVKHGELGERNLHYLIASAGPRVIRLNDANAQSTAASLVQAHDHEHGGHGHAHERRPGLVMGIGVALTVILAAMHAGFIMALYRSISDMRLSPIIYALIGAAVLVVVVLHLFGGRLITGLVSARHQRTDAD